MKVAVLAGALAAVVGFTLSCSRTAIAAPASPGAGIVFDKADPSSPDTVDIAFGGTHHPRLPAVSADGTLFADFESPIELPMMPQPYDLVVRKVGTDKVVETLPLLSYDEADAAQKAASDPLKWATPALTRTLAQRGAKALAQLHGFHSLTRIEFPVTDSSSGDQPAKIGSLVLDPSAGQLRDAEGNVLHALELPDFQPNADSCGYTPIMRWTYHDAATIYVNASYATHDGCPEPPVYIFAWSLDPAKADPAALCRNVVADQFAGTPDVPMTTNLDELSVIVAKWHQFDLSDLQATVSRDGRSGWGSVIIDGLVRASDVVVRTPKGWKLAAVAWTQDVDNDYAKREAKSGHLKPEAVPGDPGDASLRAAFAKLTTAGVDATAAARSDLVAIGSGPSERTVGGHDFARAWNAFWKGHIKIVASSAHTTPSGTTGWVSASIELAKPGYKMPFLVFAVFDKTAAGSWSLVHIHFAV